MGKASSIRSLTCNPLTLLGLVLWLMASGFCCPEDFHQGTCHCSHDHDEIVVSCRGITHVPRDLPPDTTKLYLTYCGITHIDRGSFKAMKKLSELYLSNNYISLNAFKVFSRELKTVKSLDLSGNPMGPYLTSDTFSGFNDTEYLYLADCGIAHIGGGTFRTMKNLSQLSLNYNNISMSAFKVFSRELKRVGTLHLRRNPMGPYLPSDTFSGFNDTEDLSLADCGITKIDGGTFKAMKNLRSLDLSGNKLKTFAQNTFHHLNLQTLSLSNNYISLSAFKVFSRELKSVRSLKISGNPIGPNLTSDTLSGCNDTEDLSLADCGITNIDGGTFKAMKRLRTIDLSRNNLKAFAQTSSKQPFGAYSSRRIPEFEEAKNNGFVL